MEIPHKRFVYQRSMVIRLTDITSTQNSSDDDRIRWLLGNATNWCWTHDPDGRVSNCQQKLHLHVVPFKNPHISSVMIEPRRIFSNKFRKFL